MRNVDAPVISSPCRIACCTGAAPRQAGSSEKCRLIQPCCRHVERGRRQQRAVRDDRAAVDAELAQPVEELRVAGLSPASAPAHRPPRPASATGDAVTRRPRPARAGGRVTTATTSCSASRAARAAMGTAASGVPAKASLI